jgi:hypothetical protein
MNTIKSKIVQKLSPTANMVVGRMVTPKYENVKEWLENNFYKDGKTDKFEGPFKNLSLEECTNALIYVMTFSFKMAMGHPIIYIGPAHLPFINYFFNQEIIKIEKFERSVLHPLLEWWVTSNMEREITTPQEKFEMHIGTFTL